MFEGRVALVTGAASGIGEATARRFAEERAAVLLVDIEEHGAEIAEDITNAGGTAAFFQADVADSEQVAACVASAIDHFGKLTTLVNNAGIILSKGFSDTRVEDWDRVQAVNLRAPFLGLRAAAPYLRSSSNGSVVNVASIHSHATIEGLSAYAASKSGILGLTRSAALDLAPFGVRVNAVCPGTIHTGMTDAWLGSVADPDAAMKRIVDKQPLGRIGTPNEVASAIVFLASPEASFITGAALFVDGGVTARLWHA